MAAVLACASYTVLTQRLLLDDSSETIVLCQQVAALAFALAVTGVGTATGLTHVGLPDDIRTWVLTAASGMVYYGLAFTFFIAGLRGVPAATAGAFLPLIPVFGLAAAYVTGERLLGQQWFGAGLVVAAAAVAVVIPTRPEPASKALSP